VPTAAGFRHCRTPGARQRANGGPEWGAPNLQCRPYVARIRVRLRDGRRRVIVRGELSAADLRRLERACGPALEQRDVALHVELGGVSAIDETSRLFLERLSKRGAVLT
jgi:hypothetical protein